MKEEPIADLADITAAQSAGYLVARLDRGTATRETNRYATTLEAHVVGDGVGQFPAMLRAYGESNVSADAADTAALSALNWQRAHRYGRKASDGSTLTADLN